LCDIFASRFLPEKPLKIWIFRMKILHVINSLASGGAEHLVAEMSVLQQARGNEVEVLLLRGGNSPFRNLLDDARVRVFDFGTENNVYSPRNIFRIIPFLKNYELVHVHLFPAQYWVALAKIISRSRVRLITTEHSTDNRRRHIAWAWFFDKIIYRQYSKIFGISEKTTDALKNHLGVPEGIITTIENGINLENFRSAKAFPRDALVPKSCKTLLVQVAGFRTAKDQDTVIRALKILPESVFAIFVGDGERRAECECLADELGVRSRAIFLGIRADVPAILATADIVVMSSHWEGFGLAAVEGMAARKPTLASDVPGLADVVGGAGILFPCGDASALAREISHLAEDKIFYEENANACAKRAEDFDVHKMSEAYLCAYESVL